jgi:type II secretory ATPase GspE/PulE/Tfp pilus assembly ATPase PilB-like protein
MEMTVQGKTLDMRVSVMPTPHGESLVIRLLTSRSLLTLPQLGFFEEDLPTLRRFLSDPHGIVFLTGPTGSGKTTSLYAFLNEINTIDKKIVTLEDPIEYQLDGVTQIQIHPAIGLSFASGLRSLLRHDPDVMMVGEVRDSETAETAVRTALTGHLVFSTLHTNDAPSAVTRLMDLGLDPYLISSSVNGLLAQRLVRTVCERCRVCGPLSPEEAKSLGVPFSAETLVSRGRGCADCLQTGYRGRTVIYEVLNFSPAIKDLVHDRAPLRDIRSQAAREGFVSLRRCGWKKILLGQTTPDEVLRATPLGEV